MVQTAQDRTRHDLQPLGKLVSMLLKRHRQVRRRLRDAWTQGHVRATCVIVLRPLVQEGP
jgi:hypothetical protein